MNCSNCGKSLQEDFKFCPECATPTGLVVDEKVISTQIEDGINETDESLNQALTQSESIPPVKKNNLKKTFLLTMIISLSLSALIGILVILLGEFGEFQAKVLITTLAVGGFSLLGLCCSSIFEKSKLKTFSIIGMGTCVLGLFYSLLLIWNGNGFDFLWDSETNLKILLTFLITTVSLAQASILLLIRFKNKKAQISLICTLGLIGLIALIVIGLIYEIITFDSEAFYKFLAVVIILDVLGTVVTPILNKIGDK